MGDIPQSSLRVLAPASIVLFAIVLLIVVVASVGGGDEPSSESERVAITETSRSDGAAQRRAARRRRLAERGVYVVRSGDNLSTIATRLGISVETLQELNPTADPQNLVTGQRIRLPSKSSEATGATSATGTTGAAGAD
jgi:LysM repeat protein